MTTDPKIFSRHLDNCELTVNEYQSIVKTIQALRQQGRYREGKRVQQNGADGLVKDLMKEKCFNLNGYGFKETRQLVIALFGSMKGLILNGPHDVMKWYLKRRYETPFPNEQDVIEFSRAARPKSRKRPTDQYVRAVVEQTEEETGKVRVKLRSGKNLTLGLWSDMRLRWRFYERKEKTEKNSMMIISKKRPPSNKATLFQNEQCLICVEDFCEMPWHALGPCSHRGICAMCVLRQFHFGNERLCPYCKADWSRVIFTDNMYKDYSEYAIEDMVQDPAYGILYENINIFKYFRKFTKFYCVVCDKQTDVYFQHESLYSCVVSQLLGSDGFAVKEKIRGVISTPSQQDDPYVTVGELFLGIPESEGTDEELDSFFKVGKTFRVSIKQVYKCKDTRAENLVRLWGSFDRLDNLLPRRRKLLESSVSAGGCSILAEVVEARTDEIPFRIKIRLQSSEVFQTIDDLNAHLMEHHRKKHCKLCVEANELFIFDHRLYTGHELEIHNRCGTRASDGKSSINPHPLCFFCNTRFYDHLKLYQHMKKSHYSCQICVSKMGVFFRKQHLLFEHLEKYHLVCRHESCINLFCPPVFSDALALRRHELKHTKKKKQRLRINLITLKEKPRPVRPPPGPDVTFCFPDNREPITDDNVLRSQQRENKEKFKDMERRLERDSVFANSRATLKRELPDFKREEADWRRDELYGKLQMHIKNSSSCARLLSAINLLHSGKAVCSNLFELFVGILVPYVNLMTFEDLLVDLLRTISDHSLRRDLHNVYCSWKSLPKGSRPTYETKVKSIDVTKKDKSEMRKPIVISKPKPVSKIDAWERLKMEQGWVGGGRQTQPIPNKSNQTRQYNNSQPSQWNSNNQDWPSRESITRQQAQERKVEQSFQRKNEIRIGQKSRRRGRRKSKQTTTHSNSIYEGTSSFRATPPKSASSQNKGQSRSNLHSESKVEPSVDAVHLEVNLLGTRFSACRYQDGHIDFLASFFNKTVQTLTRREVEARNNKRCLDISLPSTSKGHKQKEHTLKISRCVESFESLLAWQSLAKIKLPQHKASLIESLWQNRETMDGVEEWIESTVEDLEDNELYVLAMYMEDAIVRFLEQQVAHSEDSIPSQGGNKCSNSQAQEKASHKPLFSPSTLKVDWNAKKDDTKLIGSTSRQNQGSLARRSKAQTQRFGKEPSNKNKANNSGKRRLRGRGFDLPANIGFDLPQQLERRPH